MLLLVIRMHDGQFRQPKRYRCDIRNLLISCATVVVVGFVLK